MVMLGSLYMQGKTQTCKSTAEQSETSSEEPQRTLIMEKPVEGGRIAAYRLKDAWSLDPNYGVYAIVLEGGSYTTPLGSPPTPRIFSVLSPLLESEHIFEIVGEKLLVVNSQTNRLDVYTIQLEEVRNNVSYTNELTYDKSIELPRYKVGGIDAVECENNICKVSTTHNPDSFCTMDLELTSETYSNITCNDLGGPFTPEEY